MSSNNHNRRIGVASYAALAALVGWLPACGSKEESHDHKHDGSEADHKEHDGHDNEGHEHEDSKKTPGGGR